MPPEQPDAFVGLIPSTLEPILNERNEQMADLNKLAEDIVGLTLLQAQELKTILKDKYGIEPAAGGAVMMAAGPGCGCCRCRRREDRIRRRADRSRRRTRST